MIGITATVPVEIIFAAGLRPVDLNNLFITHENPDSLVSQAEAAGFSYNTCAWIKGIYSTVINNGINEVIAVTGGDCSNTIALGEVLERKGVKVLSFEYPFNRNREALRVQMEKLRRDLGTTWDDIENAKQLLDRIRTKLRRLDRLSWQENVVTGLENNLFLVSSSDFGGDPEKFEQDVDKFLSVAERREPAKNEIRLGYLGVPPILSRFYEHIESLAQGWCLMKCKGSSACPLITRILSINTWNILIPMIWMEGSEILRHLSRNGNWTALSTTHRCFAIGRYTIL